MIRINGTSRIRSLIIIVLSISSERSALLIDALQPVSSLLGDSCAITQVCSTSGSVKMAKFTANETSINFQILEKGGIKRLVVSQDDVSE